MAISRTGWFSTGAAMLLHVKVTVYPLTDTCQGLPLPRRRAGRRPRGQDTDGAMTRSEERLNVGTESAPAGRARLRKYVVTENVSTTVPVSHEEVRLEREPVTDANRDAALSGQDITEDEHELQLNAERPVVTKETVPVERVRLATESVVGDEQVSEKVCKERIETEGDAAPGR